MVSCDRGQCSISFHLNLSFSRFVSLGFDFLRYFQWHHPPIYIHFPISLSTTFPTYFLGGKKQKTDFITMFYWLLLDYVLSPNPLPAFNETRLEGDGVREIRLLKGLFPEDQPCIMETALVVFHNNYFSPLLVRARKDLSSLS